MLWSRRWFGDIVREKVDHIFDHICNIENQTKLILAESRCADELQEYVSDLNRHLENLTNVGMDKRGNPYFVTIDERGETCKIRLYHAGDKYKGSIPKLMLRIPDGYIMDIHSGEPCIGHGSALMHAAVQYAVRQNLQQLYGRLRPENDEHHQRLVHFYSKFGFLVENYTVRRPIR